MTYKGRIENGVLVLQDGAVLPEGAEVTVEVTRPAAGLTPLARFLLELAGKAEGLPPDAAARHDRYIYGTGTGRS